MSVYRPAGSPYYHFDFQLRGERHYGSTGCTSKTDARNFEAKKRREVATGEKKKPEITLDLASGSLWATKGKFESNATTLKGQIKRLLSRLGGSKSLSDLTTEDFTLYIAWRRAQVTKRKDAQGRPTLVTNATVNREIELARRIWRHVEKDYSVSAIEWGKLLLTEPKERVRELSAQEEKRLRACPPSDDLMAVVEFAMLSSQRRTSVITLLWSKVDFVARAAEVRVKGGHWHKFPLTPRMIAIIANQPKVGPFVFTYVCERPSPPRGDRPRRLKGQRYPFSKQGWYRKWYAWLEEAGIEDFRFHDLRHTGLSRVVRTSRNLKIGQKLAGHSNIATTARYAHVLEEDIRDAMIETESRNSPEAGPFEVTENRRNAKDSA